MSDIQPPGQPPFDWQMASILAAIAGVGGAIGYVLRSMDAGANMRLWKGVVEFVAAAFVGGLGGILCYSAFNMAAVWAFATSGLFGLIGARATTQVLQRFVWTKLGMADPRSKEDDQPTA